MARDRKRHIIAGALRLLRAEGGGAITIDATAKEVGLTKSGLFHHFPTKETLMLAVVDHVAARWERLMLDRLKKPPASAPPRERIRAYIEVALTAPFDQADFAIFSDALYRDALTDAWVRRLHPWLNIPDDLPAPTRACLTAARMMADGYWIAAATNVFAPSESDRTLLIKLMVTLLDDRPSADHPPAAVRRQQTPAADRIGPAPPPSTASQDSARP